MFCTKGTLVPHFRKLTVKGQKASFPADMLSIYFATLRGSKYSALFNWTILQWNLIKITPSYYTRPKRLEMQNPHEISESSE